VDKKDKQDLIKFLNTGNKFDTVRIVHHPQYGKRFLLIFEMNREYRVLAYKQLRNDREALPRSFSSIDVAIKFIREVGFKGDVLYNVE